jgi:hypothetical protein
MITNLLQRTCTDTLMFRQALSSLLSEQPSEPVVFRDYMYEIWAAASRLYLDQVEICKCDLDDLTARLDSSEITVAKETENPADAESRVRARLRAHLEQLTIWERYQMHNAIPASRGLRGKKDYIDSLALHLPEIYGETIRLEDWLHRLALGPTEAVLTRAIVSAEHLGRNHISYVLPALEWLADSDAWQ